MFAGDFILGMTHSTPHPSHAIDAPMVLVLPFVLLGGDAPGRPGDEYLAEGVSDELSYALTQLPSIRVIGRATAESLRGGPSPRESGQAVGATVVVTGTVEAVDGALRAEVSLATTSTPVRGSSLAATIELPTFNAGAAALAEGVALFAGADVSDDWRAQVSRPLAGDREVVDLILRGRYHVEQRPIGVKVAMQCFDRAIRLDGTAATPYGALGILWANFGLFLALPPAQARERAHEQAERALAHDPREANALAALLTVATFYDWDLARADALGAQLLEWYPSWVTPRQALLYAHAARGDAEAVRALAREVQRLDPRAVDPVCDVAFALLLVGDAREAAALLEQHAELHSEASEVHRRLGLALLECDEPSRAIAALERSVALSRRHAWGVANLACAFARAGREDDARRLLAELEERADGEIVPAIALAELHASLGRVAEGLAALERAVDARDYWLLVIDRDPLLDPLRTDPRFADIRARATPVLR